MGTFVLGDSTGPILVVKRGHSVVQWGSSEEEAAQCLQFQKGEHLSEFHCLLLRWCTFYWGLPGVPCGLCQQDRQSLGLFLTSKQQAEQLAPVLPTKTCVLHWWYVPHCGSIQSVQCQWKRFQRCLDMGHSNSRFRVHEGRSQRSDPIFSPASHPAHRTPA